MPNNLNYEIIAEGPAYAIEKPNRPGEYVISRPDNADEEWFICDTGAYKSLVFHGPQFKEWKEEENVVLARVKGIESIDGEQIKSLFVLVKSRIPEGVTLEQALKSTLIVTTTTKAEKIIDVDKLVVTTLGGICFFTSLVKIILSIG